MNVNGSLSIVSSGAALSMSSGTLNVNGGAVSGQLVPMTLSGGTLNLNTTAAVSLPSLVLSGGTLGGTAAVTVTGEFDVTSSSFLSGSGVLTTQGATLCEHGVGERLPGRDGRQVVGEQGDADDRE